MRQTVLSDHANWGPRGAKIRSYIGRVLVLIAVMILPTLPAASQHVERTSKPVVDANGTVHLPSVSVPYSDLASEEAKLAFIDYVLTDQRAAAAGRSGSTIEARRSAFDRVVALPALQRLRAAFPVQITTAVLGGVTTDVVEPREGVKSGNENRVLINLHGGGFEKGGRIYGQAEAVPIASLGSIKVITINYRMYPEHRFPAASEDVAAVYRHLLKSYPPQNIGIFGCSAGGILAAQAVAWFQKERLPRPGAIGMFGGAGLIDRWGDSNYASAGLRGLPMPLATQEALPYFEGANRRSPLVSPAYHPAVLKLFPPSLLISGTRDQVLSSVLFTHAQLRKADAFADLHVWEGGTHCSFAGHADPRVPETRDAWNVIVEFFDDQLGK